MPSLHAGLSILVATYLITRLRSPWRWLMVLYPVAMSFMLVYYAEHYVIDIIAGGVCVAVGDGRLDDLGTPTTSARRAASSEADPDDVLVSGRP